MDKQYDHVIHESTILALWEKTAVFNPDTVKKSNPSTTTNNQKSFCISMPPPNANDPLHIGHAMFVALEDILIRYHRMKGDDTVWIPGTDHAGIETQFVFEKKLKKKGESRFQYDRETLYKMIWDYVQANSDVAVNQMKRLGASADWSRFVFTLDPKNVDIVLETFQKLVAAGLVYRDQQLVNYCTHCGTAFSNLEILHEERQSPFYTMKYGDFAIGTVRPETKFRDTALAVHPEDKRYKKYIGQTFEILGLLGPTQMTVIADENVDPEFGTGIMKVTPAHDAHDFELGKKYNLPVTPIITLQGRMDMSWFLENPLNDPASVQNQSLSESERQLKQKYWDRAHTYHGLKVAAMRTQMKADLEADGLLLSYNPTYTHNLTVCYRCKNPIEPLPLPQFFIKVKPLIAPVLKDMDAGKFTVHGAGHDKILRHWLENLYDWNISRQIVWGIRMPIWYDVTKNSALSVTFLDKNGQKQSGLIGTLMSQEKIPPEGTHTLAEIAAGLQELRAPISSVYEVSLQSPGPNYIQETDTFDTWFSSSQWPFSTLQALDRQTSTTVTDPASNFNRFYPTQVMETGYDILPFWVMRMLFMGKFATRSEQHPEGQLPFTNIYLHGLVRDQKGQKMSKSKGNVVNPLEITEKYGADALRMALVIRSSAGLDKSVGDGDFKAMRNLSNKIWNAARFVLLQRDTAPLNAENLPADQAALSSITDQIVLDKLTALQAQVSKNLDQLQIGLAAETMYNEFWHWFCDQVIEAGKYGYISKKTVLFGLTTYLKLLHPFIPFVTEAIWQVLYEQQLVSHPILASSSWYETP